MIGISNPQAAILEAREERARRTQRFVERVRLPSIILTVNAPGPDKNEPWVAHTMARGTAAIGRTLAEHGLVVCEAASYESAAGPEWRGAVRLESEAAETAPSEYGGDEKAVSRTDLLEAELKRLTVGIEEAHPLGRLLDIDVFGLGAAPVGRTELGLAPRRCLVCDRPAHECVRSRRHPLSDVRAHIASLVRKGCDAP